VNIVNVRALRAAVRPLVEGGVDVAPCAPHDVEKLREMVFA
jgi:hypothetical protein